ncbi:hypothetical protein RB595_009969 [Gaeumannomyces hyphopodioides]
MDAATTTAAGFPEVSRWIAEDGDGEGFVFRKFDLLAARNLLYLQHGILALEEEIELADTAVFADGGDTAMLRGMRNWKDLVENSKDTTVSEELRNQSRKQIRLHDELKVAIKEYPLDLQARISNLSGPNRRVLGAYRAWLRSSKTLRGLSGGFLNDKLDLVALKRLDDRDSLSELLRRIWPAKSITTASGGARTARFQELSISRWVNVISTLVALALLVGSIASLYFIRDLKIKFAMIAIFAAFFALSLGIITSARRPEVFAATAAYAAVLVVFVSNQDLASQSSS